MIYKGTKIIQTLDLGSSVNAAVESADTAELFRQLETHKVGLVCDCINADLKAEEISVVTHSQTPPPPEPLLYNHITKMTPILGLIITPK